jgi:hypothetical protein
MLLPVLFTTALLAQAPSRPSPLAAPAQDLTLPPETAQLVTILEGRGVQIYTCTADAHGYSWVLTAPDAQLYNLATGKLEGHHDAGPTWTLDDGSAIRGGVQSKRAADTPADVPWLLLHASPMGETRGQFTAVSYVRRYNTHGGAAPATGCDATHTNASLRVPYTATYAFYSTAPVGTLQTAPVTSH